MPFNQINQFYGRGPHKWEELYLNGTRNTFSMGDLISEAVNTSDLHHESGANDTINNGTQRLEPLCVIILVTICYTLISVAGLLGNVITCIVISKNKSMHTATNYYLFNLAVSDLTLLLSGEHILIHLHLLHGGTELKKKKERKNKITKNYRQVKDGLLRSK